jgi:hypothetical protein
MNVQMHQLAESARSESVVCEFCGRPWFGLVAYCPYCGRKASFTTISPDPDDRLQMDEALASGQGTWRMPAGELHRQAANTPRKESHGTVLQGVPILGETLPGERNRPTQSQLNKPALALLFKAVVAGIAALLLLWMVLKLIAPKTNERTSPQLPISTSEIPSPRAAPSTSAAPVPSIPMRTGTAVPPQSDRRSLCSVANEAAGLCKSRE